MHGFDDQDLLRCALASERTYFGLGAEPLSRDGVFLANMPGLERLPASSVCIFDAREFSETEADAAISAAERHFQQAGVAMSRIYAGTSVETIDHIASPMGYRRRTEKIHAFQPLPPINGAGAVWKKVRGDDGWREKAAVHAIPSRASDGYDSPSEQWVALERQKSETGELGFWLFVQDGEAIATTGLMRCARGVLRIKNFFVRADRRGSGIGKLALATLLRQMGEAGENAIVVFSIEGSVGERLYLSSGAREIGRIYEWSRPLLEAENP